MSNEFFVENPQDVDGQNNRVHRRLLSSTDVIFNLGEEPQEPKMQLWHTERALRVARVVPVMKMNISAIFVWICEWQFAFFFL